MATSHRVPGVGSGIPSSGRKSGVCDKHGPSPQLQAPVPESPAFLQPGSRMTRRLPGASSNGRAPVHRRLVGQVMVARQHDDRGTSSRAICATNHSTDIIRDAFVVEHVPRQQQRIAPQAFHRIHHRRQHLLALADAPPGPQGACPTCGSGGVCGRD